MWIFCSLLVWFSDSADWMWPCDPWLPGKERWGYGCWGYSWGEPAPEDYQRSAWYAAFMCVLVCMCETGCGHFFSQQRRQKVSHCDLRDISTLLYTWNYLAALIHQISLWNGRLSHSCCKGVVDDSVIMQRDRKCVLRVHPSQVSFQLLRWIRGK